MLVDLKVKDSKSIEPNSVLITDDGKTFYPVKLEVLLKDILAQVSDMTLLLQNNQNRIEAIETKVNGKIMDFVRSFVGGK